MAGLREKNGTYIIALSDVAKELLFGDVASLVAIHPCPEIIYVGRYIKNASALVKFSNNVSVS